jgi:hypothetical protein
MRKFTEEGRERTNFHKIPEYHISMRLEHSKGHKENKVTSVIVGP